MLGQLAEQREQRVEQLELGEVAFGLAVVAAGRRGDRDRLRRFAAFDRRRHRAGQQPAQRGPAGDGDRVDPLEQGDDLGEGQVGQAGLADVETASGQHQGALLGGIVGELVEQPGLADARVPGDQHRAGRAGIGTGQRGA